MFKLGFFLAISLLLLPLDSFFVLPLLLGSYLMEKFRLCLLAVLPLQLISSSGFIFDACNCRIDFRLLLIVFFIIIILIIVLFLQLITLFIVFELFLLLFSPRILLLVDECLATRLHLELLVLAVLILGFGLSLLDGGRSHIFGEVISLLMIL